MNKLLALLVLTVTIYGQEYVGSHKCKACHRKSSSGAQYKVWEKTNHAHAFETLKTDEAIQVANEHGIKGNPWEAPECVICHTTGFENGGYEIKDAVFWDQVDSRGRPAKDVKRMTGLQGVGCEVCHGPGSEYKSKKKMEAIFQGVLDGEELGMFVPSEEVCLQCHNSDAPSFNGFDYKESYHIIAHPYPDGFREAEAVEK